MNGSEVSCIYLRVLVEPASLSIISSFFPGIFGNLRYHRVFGDVFFCQAAFEEVTQVMKERTGVLEACAVCHPWSAVMSAVSPFKGCGFCLPGEK